jgi:hypothetical protein
MRPARAPGKSMAAAARWRRAFGRQTPFMATTKGNEKKPRWTGEEVERRTGDEAERAAERAEGNEPVRADAEARRQRELDDADAQDGQVAAHPPEVEDTEDIAEEHRERLETEGHSPRSKM